MRYLTEQGTLVQIVLPGTIMHGRFGVITSTVKKTPKWPALVIIQVDCPQGLADSDTVHELHLTMGEVLVLG